MEMTKPNRADGAQLIRSPQAREHAATAALVAKARADIEARWTMAMHRPRDERRVSEAILAECRRWSFADAAIYHKPVGEGIEGLSIRFAETAARLFGNIATEVTQIYDDEHTRVVRVSATDLESNVTWPQDVTIAKVVERSHLRQGQQALGERTNSYGKRVFIVDASDDEILNKQNALVSKALRTCLLRIIPGYMQDEAFQACQATLRDHAQRDPGQAKGQMIRSFEAIGVGLADIEQWLGHRVEEATTDEIGLLRRVYGAIRDGEGTWAQALEHRNSKAPAQAPAQADPVAPAEKSSGRGTSAAKDALRAKNGYSTTEELRP